MTATNTIGHRRSACDLDGLATLRLLWRIVERARLDARNPCDAALADEAKEWLDSNGFGHESLRQVEASLP